MEDNDALKFLMETMENAKKTTEDYSCAFYRIFSQYSENLFRISQHIQNDNFRLFSLHFTLLRNVFISQSDYKFQNLVLEELKETQKEEEDIRMELILDIVSRALRITVFSEDDGRDVVDMTRLRKDLYPLLGELDEATKIYIILKVSSAIRALYDSGIFIEARKNEMLRVYDKIIKSCEKSWLEVFDVLSESLRDWDKAVLIWKREAYDR